MRFRLPHQVTFSRRSLEPRDERATVFRNAVDSVKELSHRCDDQDQVRGRTQARGACLKVRSGPPPVRSLEQSDAACATRGARSGTCGDPCQPRTLGLGVEHDHRAGGETRAAKRATSRARRAVQGATRRSPSRPRAGWPSDRASANQGMPASCWRLSRAPRPWPRSTDGPSPPASPGAGPAPRRRASPRCAGNGA